MTWSGQAGAAAQRYAAIAAMTPQRLAYKGLTEARERLLSKLAALVARVSEIDETPEFPSPLVGEG